MKILQRHPEETGRAYALRVLRTNIINNELAPGSLVSENEIAGVLGLSRVPVREALIELAQSKIIEILPQRGSRIALIDLNLVDESNFFRKSLECAVVRLACEMLNENDLLELDANLNQQEFYLANPSPAHLMQLDNEFHEKLFKACNKESCYQMITNMGIHFDRIRTLALSVVKDLKIVGDHRRILMAIREKNADLAAELMDKHLSRFQLDEMLIKEHYPDYFKL